MLLRMERWTQSTGAYSSFASTSYGCSSRTLADRARPDAQPGPTIRARHASYERYNRSWVDLNVVSPVQGRDCLSSGAAWFSPTRILWRVRYDTNNFAPRFGFRDFHRSCCTWWIWYLLRNQRDAKPLTARPGLRNTEHAWNVSLDSGVTQYASLVNPLPGRHRACRPVAAKD